MLGCVIVNYRSPWEMLRRCLESISEDNADIACRITLVDNASGDGVIDLVRKKFPAVDIIEMPVNAGFAAAVNRGLEEVEETLVLMLNTDAVLTPGALAAMLESLNAAGESVAGVAPKMLSSAHEGIIDAVGIVVPASGAAFNRGIGQCDLGQYDRSDEVAGVCFGAALLRRDLFDPEKVGPLYERYFLYFEDSDWCVRAVSQGYRFATAPRAVVAHMHSGVTRHEALPFKYGLIELNTLRMVTRTLESPARVARIVTSRCARLLARTFIRRKFIGPNLKTMAIYLRELPALLGERRALQEKRLVSDSHIFALAEGESAFFDTVAYRPDRVVDSLIDTYLRLLKVKHDPELGKILAALYRLGNQSQEARITGGAPAIDPETAALFTGQPSCVRELLGLTG